jgi:hypothetical protein
MTGTRPSAATRRAIAVLVTAAMLPGMAASAVAIEPQADLAVTVADPDPVLVGEFASFFAQVVNTGPQAVDDIYLNLTVSGVSISLLTTSTTGCSASGSIVLCHWTSVDPGVTRSVTVRAMTVEAGELRLTASASSPTEDPDLADNRVTATAMVLEPDETPPAISITHEADANGWNGTSPVRVAITAADAGGSGVASIACTDTLAGTGPATGTEPAFSAQVSGEGVHVLDCTATDEAGNTSGPVTDTIRIDTTPPTLACAATAPEFLLGQAGAIVSASVSDSRSGPDASTVWAAVDTTSAGPGTAVLTGHDLAGNTAAVTCPYTVGYAFSGFASPVDGGGVVNVVKAGRAIPLKWRLTDAAGAPVTGLTAASVTVQGLACSAATATDVIEESYPGGSGLQDLGDGYYQVNWKTPSAYAGSCRTMRLDLGEGVVHTALFQFTK